MSTPHSPYEPPTTPIAPLTPPELAAGNRGSRWRGFGLFWLILVVGWVVAVLAALLLSELFPGFSSGDYGFGFMGMTVLMLLPWLAELVIGIRLAIKGKTQTALGMLFGFLSLFGVGLLLVAACFGFFILSGESFH